MTEFSDDVSYFRWLKDTPNGFVLNLRRGPSPDYIVLHRTSCWTISSRTQEAGAYTERAYRKIGERTISALRDVAKREGRADGSFSNECSACSPTGEKE